MLLPVQIRRPAAVAGSICRWLILLTPTLAAAERLLRGADRRLFINDLCLDALATLAMVPGTIALNEKPVWLIVLIILAVAVLDLKGKPRRPLTIAFSLGRATILFAVFIGAFFGLAIWFSLAGWQPWPTTAVAVFLGVLSLLGGRRYPRWKRWTWLAAAGVAIPLFIAANFWTFSTAQRVAWRQLAPFPAYDAVQREGIVIAAARSAPAARALRIDRTHHYRFLDQSRMPERLAVDEATGRFYLANYGGSGETALTEVDGEEAVFLSLPGCDKTIDLDLSAATGELWAACEKSQSLHRFDLERRVQTGRWDLPGTPYGLALDEALGVAYITVEFFSMHNFVFDLRREEIIAAIVLGPINWGVAVDPATHRFFIARPLTGEVLAFDRSLRPVARFTTGCAPRDLAVDGPRRRLLVANYLSGNVTVIDLDRLVVTGQLRVGLRDLMRRLRGVAVADNGDWLATDASGVWRLTGRQVDALPANAP